MPLIVFLYALLASTFLFAKFALDYAAPVFLIGFRMTLAGLLLLSYLLLFKRESLRIQKGDAAIFLRVSFFHIYLAFVAEFWALQYLSSSKTNLIYSLTPLIAAVLSFFLLKERLSLLKRGAMALGFLGLAPTIFSGTDFQGAETFRISLPETVLLIAVASASYAWFDIKKLMGKGYNLLFINGFSMLIGGVGAFATSFATEGLSPLPITEFWPFLGFVLLLILASNIICYNLYGHLLKKYSITFLTFAGFLCPLFGTFMGWFFRDEPLPWTYWISLGAIGSALFLFYHEELKAPVAMAKIEGAQ